MIAGFLNEEERSEARPRPQQYHQHMNHFHQRGNFRQPGAAPSDGGLLPASSQESKSNTTPSLADEKGRDGQNASEYSVKGPSRSALTKPSSGGLQPLQQQQQQCDSTVRQRSGALASSPLSVGERRGDVVGMAKDEVGDRLTVTEDDVRRAYATLQNQSQQHSKNLEDKTPAGDQLAAGQQTRNQPPAQQASLKDCGVSRDKTCSRDVAAGARSLGVNHISKTPSVPTGAPASPTRRGVMASTISLARANLAPAVVEETVKLTKHTENLGVRTPDGEQATEAESAGVDLVDLARERVQETTEPPPPTAGFAVPLIEPTAIKLANGLGSWADETVAVGRLVDQDSRRIADERAEEAREERDIRRTLKRGMGMVVKSLPIGVMKDFGYLEEAQKRGLEKTTMIMDRMAAVAQLRAWQK